MLNVKVGVVENEMVIAETICLTLRKLGYDVLPPAFNYQQGLQMISGNIPDLILLDINLGNAEKDGIDIAKHVRQHYSIPIIFLTANSDKPTVERAKIVMPDAFLVKPFSKDDLYASIEIALNNHRNIRPSNLDEGKDFIMVKDGYSFIKVNYRDILYLSSDQNYVTFHLVNTRKCMMRSTLQEMSSRMPEENFIKINRSFIINVQHVTKVETDKIFIGDIVFPCNKSSLQDLILSKL